MIAQSLRKDSEYGFRFRVHMVQHYITRQVNAMHIPLKRLKFLALDCQTTGNSPKSSNLLEIGWLECSSTESPSLDISAPTTFVLRQPEQNGLSKRIQKLTGIGDDQMEDAVAPQTALDALLKKAAGVARLNDLSHCPVVIHYARFEMGFLIALHETHHPGVTIPIRAICTHQVVSKLMPQLPRKGIRAVAGYLGHSVPVAKRCAHHLTATTHIWRHLVDLLADQEGVQTLDQLQRWLKRAPAASTAKSFPMPREKRLELPESPGIYRMLRSNGDVLYIGKATSLKKRVNSYFHKKRHSEALLEMLTQAVGLETTETGSAVEAALMESDAIKASDPPYNSALVNRHRDLVFVSRDFGVQSEKMSNGCPLGPISSINLFKACHSLGEHLMARNSKTPDIPRMMAIPEADIPDAATFASGLALFMEKQIGVLKRMDPVRSILHIGRQSWLEKLERKAAEEECDIESIPSAGHAEFEWTSEAVASSMESLCRRCGFMLRRARWFALLSESTLAWQAGNKTQGAMNIIVMQHGDMVTHYQTEPGSPIPSPPGAGEIHTDRRGRIDLMRYDRLRVMTTEMRRLLSEGRLECVRLSDKAYLYPKQLIRLFNWV